jgi:predicted GTPase
MDVYQSYAVSQTLKKEIREAGVNVLCVDYMKEEKKFRIISILDSRDYKILRIREDYDQTELERLIEDVRLCNLFGV